MPQNFIEGRREQGFLLPPDVRDWLAADHLAWFVIDAVGQMDLSAFYAAYRADGHGRAAYEPSLMVTLISYAFATGVRSSRAIERHCREHVAFRVVTGNLVPDHVTVARFICRHQQALSGLFTEVLKLCHQAGLVQSGVVSIDGTRIAGNANPDVNFPFEQIAREVLAEVTATDEAEDQEFGEARGDELPEQLRTPEGRREFFRQVRQELANAERSEDPDEIEHPQAQVPEEPSSTPEFCFDSSHITDAGGGRRRWLSEAKRQLEQHRWDSPDSILRSRVERLLLALRRLEADLSSASPPPQRSTPGWCIPNTRASPRACSRFTLPPTSPPRSSPGAPSRPTQTPYAQRSSPTATSRDGCRSMDTKSTTATPRHLSSCRETSQTAPITPGTGTCTPWPLGSRHRRPPPTRRRCKHRSLPKSPALGAEGSLRL
jgi:transposase